VRLVLITGCSSGIGRALAEAFAANGDTVIATARRPETIADLAERGCDTLALDVNDATAIDRCVAAIDSRHGRLDMIVHNAGMAAMGPVADLPVDRLRAQLETNTVAPIVLTQKALPLLQRSDDPRLVFIGSVSGILATPFAAAYCASKAALHKLIDGLRMELAPFGVKVINVQPGGVKSRFGENATSGLDDWLDERSAYWPIREAMRGHLRPRPVQQKGATAAEEVAKRLVAELGKPEPKAVIRLAKGSRLLPFLERWIPIRVRDRMLRRRFGLESLSRSSV